MLSQHTSAELIEAEKRVVQRLTGLGDVSHIVFTDTGWMSRVYIVNGGQFVVKCPRGEEVRREYVKEIAVLNLLGKIDLAVQVPKVLWSHPDNDYLGFAGIVGREFAQVVERAPSDTRRSVGRAIGGFLKQLHASKLDGAPTMTPRQEIDELRAKYELGLSVIARELTIIEQAALEDLVMTALPRELLEHDADPTLCHGDLGYWNMVLKDDGQIGVIAFGDAGYYDRSKDFMGLRDADLLDAALDAYGDGDAFRRRIRLRQRMLNIVDLPFFIGKGDETGIARTVAGLKAELE
jgi:aminoglycoside phosphotransferase (APT) family kinase protein